MAGILYGVGVGPGDPELLTIKALNLIRSCDMIGIPVKDAASCSAYRIVLKAAPEIADKPVITVPIPMTTDKKELESAYETGCRRIEKELSKSLKIAFLNLGDPTVYGTYMGIHERIVKDGYHAELISGVPSFCAVAAALQIPLASGEESIHILPAYYRFEEAEKYDGTRILMKPAGRLPEVKRRLAELEGEGKLSAYAVTNCGMKDQAVYREIGELSDHAGYFTTIIVKEKRTYRES